MSYLPELTVGEVGEAIQIVNSNDEHSFELNEDALEKVLLQEEIKDLPVAVVSIAGAFRKGKSFMLDFFLRYLKAGVSLNYILVIILYTIFVFAFMLIFFLTLLG